MIIEPKEYWVVVRVRDLNICQTIDFLKWEGFTLAQLVKWSWYFRYREALMVIKYPRCEVTLTKGQQEPSERTAENIFKNRLRAKKAKITEIKNKIAWVENEWDELFPVETDELYQRAKAKLARLEYELEQFIIHGVD